MSEAYDPFALEEEVDYEDAESEDNEAEPAATGGSSPERSSTVAPVSDASLSGGDATDICGQKRAREHDPNDSEEAAADPNAISLSAQTPPSRVPRTEDEKVCKATALCQMRITQACVHAYI